MVKSTAIACIAVLLGAPVSRAAEPPAPQAVGQPELVAQLGHTGWVRCSAFSPDGRLVLTGGLDGTARLWETATQREIRRFEGHTSLVTSVAFSPDGRTLLTGGWDDAARLWDAASGRELRRFEHPSRVTSVAFSPDGRAIATACDDRLARLWDAATGSELRRLEGHEGAVESVAVSPDGRTLATGSRDRTARLWDAATGVETRRLAGHAGWIVTVAFSPDGGSVLTASSHLAARNADHVARLWDTATGKELRKLAGHTGRIVGAAYSRDGRRVVTGSDDRSLRVWDAATGAELCQFLDLPWGVSSVAISSDGRFLLSTTGLLSSVGAAQLWDADEKKSVGSFGGQSRPVTSVAASPDGRYILTGGPGAGAALWDTRSASQPMWARENTASVALLPDGRLFAAGGENGTLTLWDAVAGVKLFVRTGHTAAVTTTAWSPDGRFLLTASLDGTAKLWNAASGDQVRTFTHGAAGSIVAALSPDARYVLTGGADGAIQLWDATTGSSVRSSKGHVNAVTAIAFSPDGRLALTGSKDYSARLWDVASGAELRGFGVGSTEVIAVAFSSESRSVLVGGRNGNFFEVDTQTGKPIRGLALATEINSLAVARDGRLAVAGCDDGTTRLWDLGSKQTLCDLVFFPRGWAVIDPEGRFDANSLEEIPGLHWVVPDDPFRPLPIEIFMRDYFEPGLLRKLVEGDRLPPVRDIASLNRAQPTVTIADVRVEGASGETVAVRVEVAPGDSRSIHDVRLFRDGQLVGYAPKAPGVAEDLGAWRRATRIDFDPGTGKASLEFSGIRLPRDGVKTSIELAAYAFNSDRVKSATTRKTFPLPGGRRQARGRAYVISVGVNASANPRLNLRFAAGDARRIQSLVGDRLDATKQFEEVVRVPLLSDYRSDGDTLVATETLATKANLEAVLALLAGKAVDPALRATIPNAGRLGRATPEDLVLLTFSGHGYADGRGEFYLVPYDVAPDTSAGLAAGGASREITHGDEGAATGPSKEVLERCVSSRELSEWLRDVDAGTMAMIVDACQSAASVEAGGFKPGPMGSRGLGQLAYDKGMLILAATQADNIALESRAIRQGLLTYSLLDDGLERAQADFDPSDGRITLREWLGYGVTRVPALVGELSRMREDAADRPRMLVLSASGEAAQAGAAQRARAPKVQQPVLFDFGRAGNADVVFNAAELERGLEAFVGRYALPSKQNPHHFCDVTVERGLLQLRPSRSLKHALVRRSETTFAFDELRDRQITFEFDSRGTVTGFVASSGAASPEKATKIVLPPPSLEGNVTFTLAGYANARIVSVVGAFNKDDPSRHLFAREGDRWVCRIKLDRGTYGYRFVVDGEWILDPANPETLPGQGATHSILVVEK